MIYEAEKYGSYRKAYLALLADSGLVEPTGRDLKTINRILNSPSEQMKAVYKFCKTKFVWVVKVSTSDIITPTGIELRNVTTFSNGSVIITPG